MSSHFDAKNDEKQVTANNDTIKLPEKQLSYRWTVADTVDDLTLPVKHSSRILYTCISVSKTLISIGTSTGAIYFFESSSLKNVGLKYGEKNANVQQILFSNSGHLLGVYTTPCQVEIWSVNRSRGLIVDKVRSINCQPDSKVTALCWHPQDTSLFIGFSNGNVTELNAALSKARDLIRLTADVIMKLDTEVVQIDCYENKMVVSTLTKSYLSSIDQGSYSQIGKKLREGQFGACFLNHNGSSFIYCSRPGLRLWQTDMNGVVLQTIQLKDTLPAALASCIDLKSYNESTESGTNAPSVPSSWQFKYLSRFRCQYLLTYKSPCVCVIDPVDGRVEAAASDITDVLDLAVFDNYVLILRSDNRVQKLSCLSAFELVKKAAEMAMWSSCLHLCVKYESTIVAEHRDASIVDAVCRLQQALTDGHVEHVFSDKLKQLAEKLSHLYNNNNNNNDTVPLLSKQTSFTQLSSGLYVNALGSDKTMIADGSSNTSRQNSHPSPTPTASSSKINIVTSVTHSLSSELRRMKSKLVEPLRKKQSSRFAVDQSDAVSHSSVSTEEDRQSIDSLDVSGGGGTEISGSGCGQAMDRNVSCGVDDCVSCSSGSTGVSSELDIDDGLRPTTEGTVECQTAVVVTAGVPHNNTSIKAAGRKGEKVKKRKNFRVITLDDSDIVSGQGATHSSSSMHKATDCQVAISSVSQSSENGCESTTITANIVNTNTPNTDAEGSLSATITAVDSDYDSSSLKDERNALDDKTLLACERKVVSEQQEATNSLNSEQGNNEFDGCEAGVLQGHTEFGSFSDSLKTLTDSNDGVDGERSHGDGRTHANDPVADGRDDYSTLEQQDNASSDVELKTATSNSELVAFRDVIERSAPREGWGMCNCGFARPLLYDLAADATADPDIDQLCSLPQQHINDLMDLCLQRGHMTRVEVNYQIRATLCRCWILYLTMARKLRCCTSIRAELLVQLADKRLLSADCSYGYLPANKEEWLSVLKLMERSTGNIDAVMQQSAHAYRRRCVRCNAIFVLTDEPQYSNKACSISIPLLPLAFDTQPPVSQSNSANITISNSCIHVPLSRRPRAQRLHGDEMTLLRDEDCYASSETQHLLTWRSVASASLQHLGPTLTLQLLSEVTVPSHELPVNFFVSALRLGACQLKKRFRAEKITANLKLLMSVAYIEQEKFAPPMSKRVNITRDCAELFSESKTQCAACNKLLVDSVMSPHADDISMFACGCVYHGSCCTTLKTCVRHTTRT